MTGMARKKVNWDAQARHMPQSRPPMMVEPLRDVPGMSASTCQQPTMKRLPVGDAAQLGGGGHTGAALDEDEGDAVDDQHDRDDDAVIKMCVDPVVQRQAQHGGGQAGDDDLEPQPHDRPADVLRQAGVTAIVRRRATAF